MIFVLNQVDTFDKKEAREMVFVRFLNVHFILIWRQCAHLCPYFFLRFLKCAIDEHTIFFLQHITSRDIFI